MTVVVGRVEEVLEQLGRCDVRPVADARDAVEGEATCGAEAQDVDAEPPALRDDRDTAGRERGVGDERETTRGRVRAEAVRSDDPSAEGAQPLDELTFEPGALVGLGEAARHDLREPHPTATGGQGIRHQSGRQRDIGVVDDAVDGGERGGGGQSFDLLGARVDGQDPPVEAGRDEVTDEEIGPVGARALRAEHGDGAGREEGRERRCVHRRDRECGLRRPRPVAGLTGTTADDPGIDHDGSGLRHDDRVEVELDDVVGQ